MAVNLSFSEDDFLKQEKSAKRKDMAGAFASWLNSMSINPDPNLPQVVQAAQARRADELKNNRTVNMLEEAGRDDIAKLVKTGVITGKEGAAQLFAEANAVRAQQRAMELARFEAGLRTPKTFQYQQLAKDLLDQGIAKTEQEALQMALSQSKAGTTVNVGPQGVPYGDPPKDTAWARNADGTVKTDERGVPIALPIQGTKLFKESEKIGEKEGQVQEETTVTAGVVLGNIDKIRKRMEESILPTTGIFGQALRNVGGTAALDVKKLIEPIQASIGFDRLQRMRDASPTGGALGQVSERELDLLMSTLSNLDQAQSGPQFLQALSQVETRYANIIRKFNAYPEDAMRAAGYEPISIGAPQPTQGGGAAPDFSKMTDEELDAYIRSLE